MATNGSRLVSSFQWNAQPPFQVVVYVPGTTASMVSSSDELADLYFVDFIPRSDRAFLYPVYKYTYERRAKIPIRGPTQQRDAIVMKVKDLRRSVDYLLTRDDIDSTKMAYLGLSAGGEYGPTYTSIERRFATHVFLSGGFDDTHMLGEPPEMNPWNYAPRVRKPILMINGRNDFGLPVETGQLPMFRMLGVEESQKRHVVLDGGHLPSDHYALIRETLSWLDHYLGPVSRK